MNFKIALAVTLVALLVHFGECGVKDLDFQNRPKVGKGNLGNGNLGHGNLLQGMEAGAKLKSVSKDLMVKPVKEPKMKVSRGSVKPQKPPRAPKMKGDRGLDRDLAKFQKAAMAKHEPKYRKSGGGVGPNKFQEAGKLKGRQLGRVVVVDKGLLRTNVDVYGRPRGHVNHTHVHRVGGRPVVVTTPYRGPRRYLHAAPSRPAAHKMAHLFPLMAAWFANGGAAPYYGGSTYDRYPYGPNQPQYSPYQQPQKSRKRY